MKTSEGKKNQRGTKFLKCRKTQEKKGRERKEGKEGGERKGEGRKKRKESVIPNAKCQPAQSISFEDTSVSSRK